MSVTYTKYVTIWIILQYIHPSIYKDTYIYYHPLVYIPRPPMRSIGAIEGYTNPPFFKAKIHFRRGFGGDQMSKIMKP